MAVVERAVDTIIPGPFTLSSGSSLWFSIHWAGETEWNQWFRITPVLVVGDSIGTSLRVTYESVLTDGSGVQRGEMIVVNNGGSVATFHFSIISVPPRYDNPRDVAFAFAAVGPITISRGSSATTTIFWPRLTEYDPSVDLEGRWFRLAPALDQANSVGTSLGVTYEGVFIDGGGVQRGEISVVNNGDSIATYHVNIISTPALSPYWYLVDFFGPTTLSPGKGFAFNVYYPGETVQEKWFRLTPVLDPGNSIGTSIQVQYEGIFIDGGDVQRGEIGVVNNGSSIALLYIVFLSIPR
jgi:hypothetical protein